MIHGRAEYQASVARKRLTLPGQMRLAIHLIVNVEAWRYDAKLPRQVLTAPHGAEPIPDVPNFAWFEYGMRVGIFRVFDALRGARGHVTLAINGAVCEAYPQIVETAVREGWEMMGHGFEQRAMSLVEDERTVVRQTLDALEKATGKRPRGWLGPGLVETAKTLDVLAEEGLVYCCDWGPADDLPYDLHVARGRMIAVPYPIDMNDIVIYGLEKRPDDTLLDRGKRQFDRLYRESERQAKVLAIAFHPWIIGVPHRIAFLEELLSYMLDKPGVGFMSAGELADWYASMS
ncbi:MAG: polysaccharide deacetylase family protein [Vulcanimicrobiaceae bacterium]